MASVDNGGKVVRVAMDDLPILVEVVGPRQERVCYLLNPAGRKRVGACLNAIRADALNLVRHITAR